MSLREWFYQLFHFRSIIRQLQADNTRLEQQFADQDRAITTLRNALIHVTTPEPVKTEPDRPLRTYTPRKTYTEMQREYEQGNNWRIRQEIEKQRRLEERQRHQ